MSLRAIADAAHRLAALLEASAPKGLKHRSWRIVPLFASYRRGL
jgi:hypothetical protein